MGSNPSLEAQLAALKQIRAMNAALYEKEIPLYSRAVAACTHAQFTVHTDHDGEFDVPVLVHTPKAKTPVNSRILTVVLDDFRSKSTRYHMVNPKGNLR